VGFGESAESSELSFAAFYADCEHEVRPITEGNRVCLVYNLILEQRSKSGSQPVRAPDYEKEVAAVATLFRGRLAAHQETLWRPGIASK
jgi:hypothetical protein